MQHLKRSPGTLAGSATGAKENPTDTQYSVSRSRQQAQRLGHATAQAAKVDGAKSLRTRSDYPPGSAFKPDEETLSRRKAQVLELLQEYGSSGVTRLEAPDHLVLSFSQRVSELRRLGYVIHSKRERVGDSVVARYVLVSTHPRAT